MKWITREHVKVDRVACPWLIKKFVDKDADLIVSFACDAGRKLAPGKAEERWDDCPTVSEDFDVAWKFITGRVETLVDRLSAKRSAK